MAISPIQAPGLPVPPDYPEPRPIRTNHAGQPVKEETIYSMCGQVFAFDTKITDEMRDSAIALLCEKLRVDIVLTNATKHGHTQLVLRDAT